MWYTLVHFEVVSELVLLQISFQLQINLIANVRPCLNRLSSITSWILLHVQTICLV